MARPLRAALASRGTRASKITDSRLVRERLVSVAGLIGRPITLADQRTLGAIVDLVVRWTGESYPAVNGLVARIGRQRVFVPAEHLGAVTASGATLASSRLDVATFARREGEALLMGDIVDRQLVDIEGIQVVRAADLYLAEVRGQLRLVGVEVGVVTLLRRLGPARWRGRPTPERVLDWADVQPLGGQTVRLDRPNRELRRLRPGDLAELLAQVSQPHRTELVEALDAAVAADVLEEMDEAQRDRLLRDIEPDRAAEILREMEPDEAVEALRDLADDERGDLLARLPADAQYALARLLGYDEDTAGGMMTSTLVLAAETDTVAVVVDRLRAQSAHRDDIDAVIVVDGGGHVVDDVTLFELAVARPMAPMSELVGPPWPTVVEPSMPLRELVGAVLANRRSSIVVVDDEGNPVGRILLDDILDALSSRPLGLHRELSRE